MGRITKLLDGICFLYFLTHIPITILVDSQAVLPKDIYPPSLQSTLEWYGREFKDPMMLDPPAWFKSFCVCECLLQFPFFFFAAAAFWNGSASKLRIPLIVYSAHVATTLVPIMSHIMFHDFSDSKHQGPITMEEKLKLLAIYSPYLVVPLLILVRAVFFATGEEDNKKAQSQPVLRQKQQTPKKQKYF